LRVRDRMATAIGDAHLDPLFGHEPGEELGAFGLRGAGLEMSRPGTAQRAAAQQGAANIGATAAGSRNDSAWRRRQRRQPRAEDPGLMQQLERVLVSDDVQLKARRAVERAALVRSDLRRDAECAQQAE